MSEKLLPCPLCGGCPVLTEAMTEHWVSCGTCGASGGMHGRLKLAVEAWNRRTPAPEGEAWRTVPVEPTEAMIEAAQRATPTTYLFDGEPSNIWSAMLTASPVVPVGSGEGERKLVGQDYINAIKAHRVEHGSSLAVARNAVDCGWRPPAPVVPVGVSSEEIARTLYEATPARVIHPLPVHSLSWDEIKTDDPARADRAYREADAILAALRPTDTGWRDIATAPINERILVWVTGKMMPGARFGSAYRGANGKVIAKPEGGNGDWTKEITYWMPLPSAPTDTGANHD